MDQIVERPHTRESTSSERIEDVLSIDGKGRPRRSRRRGIVWLAVILAAGAAVAGAYAYLSKPAAEIVYRTAPAERGQLVVEVSATGTLQPLTQVEVSSELSGVMRSVVVDDNDRVSEGDVLAMLDTTRVEAEIERARANVSAARARVTDARVTANETGQALERAQELSGRGMLADQALETASAARDRAESAVAIAMANLEVAEAELKLQQADLAKSSIHAPIDGIVLSRTVNPGQTVASSMSAPVLFLIAENLETMQLNAAIDEADIGAIEAGQPARFTVDAYPGRVFDAEIRDVSFASVVTEGVVTYEARLNVDNADLLLRPGMTATVDIVTRKDDDVLLVPAAAFRYSPRPEAESQGWGIQSLFMPRMRGFGRSRSAGAPGSGDGRPIHVMRDGAVEQVMVEPGDGNGENVEILSGLEEGDRVVLGETRR